MKPAKRPPQQMRCPAYISNGDAKENGLKNGEMQCQFALDLTVPGMTAKLAEYKLLVHLRHNHPRWWERHGKKRLIQFSKRITIGK